MMTNERADQIAALCRWHRERSNEITATEEGRDAFGKRTYTHNKAARDVLTAWYREKLDALSITRDELDEYDAIVEMRCERADYFARGEHLR